MAPEVLNLEGWAFVTETERPAAEPTAEELIREYLEHAREAIAGTPAEAAMEAYATVEPFIPNTLYQSGVRFSTTTSA